jgi:DNA-nicking Smr family endonuclease
MDRRKLESLYDAYAPTDDILKQKELEEQELFEGGSVGFQSRHAGRAESIKDIPPQQVLDLHGLTGDEAYEAVMDFLQESAGKKLKKVLIIHGKGNHSSDEPVLKRVVKACLEASPHAGRSGHPGRVFGGTGATWVVLKLKA